jgi:hypothetical protein
MLEADNSSREVERGATAVSGEEGEEIMRKEQRPLLTADIHESEPA